MNAVMLSDIMVSVAIIQMLCSVSYPKCHYAECPNAECHKAEVVAPINYPNQTALTLPGSNLYQLQI